MRTTYSIISLLIIVGCL